MNGVSHSHRSSNRLIIDFNMGRANVFFVRRSLTYTEEEDLQSIAMEKGVFLVLHGASGLPEELVKKCIKLGIRKFNVNTEVRNAYLDSLKNPKKDFIHQMTAAKEAMKAVVMEKMRLFGSSGKAPWLTIAKGGRQAGPARARQDGPVAVPGRARCNPARPDCLFL
ncbi:hypothetical protein EJ110_NYTH44735 [Nymphaea thermarum]|nr:hypothetical protein EJ110_NYTH44735 [Nymphaea thermarum]